MKLRFAPPLPALCPYVLRFEQREARLDDGVVIYPIAARPNQFLEFYLQQRYVVHSHNSDTLELAPSSVIVGPSTYRRVDLVLEGRFEVFTIHFQPSGFFQLFGLPMHTFTDRAYDARSVLGASIAELESRLTYARNFGSRVDAASAFLVRRISALNFPDGVARLANQMLLERGLLSVRAAATRAGLSVRQFERRFLQQVGVTPKRYGRIVRFQEALNMRLGTNQNWTDIAQEYGYYDQMHMVHDFRVFSGANPTEFSRIFKSILKQWG